MKKVLSIIIVALLCLSVPFSLASCGVGNDKDEVRAAANYAYLSSGTDEEPSPKPDIEPRSESELIEIIVDLTGSYSYSRITNIDNSAVSLRALFTDGNQYAAYTVTSSEYAEVETEGITFFYPDGRCDTTHILTWNTGHGEGYGDFADNFASVDNEGLSWVYLVSGATYTSENYRNAIKAASNYIAKTYGYDRRNPMDMAAELMNYLNGESNVVGLPIIIGAEGITDIFQDTISGSFIVHVNTYVVGASGETGVEAMIVIRDDMTIEHIAPMRYNFAIAEEGATEPSDEEVYEYFRQFEGLTTDTLYEVESISGCSMVCDEFMMVATNSLYEAEEHKASAFVSVFGSGVSIPHVILGLAVVLIAVIVLLVVLAIILLTPVVILAIIIIIIIIIVVSVKKRKKKKLAAKKAAEESAASEVKAEAEPAEAVTEEAATEE